MEQEHPQFVGTPKDVHEMAEHIKPIADRYADRGDFEAVQEITIFQLKVEQDVRRFEQ